jgi:hypothetical protein
MRVFNPPNAVPIVLERASLAVPDPRSPGWAHTKCLYRLAPESMAHLRGCTADMCYTGSSPRGASSVDGGDAWPEPAPPPELWRSEDGEESEAAAAEAAAAGGAGAARRGSGGDGNGGERAPWAQLGGGWEGEVW